MITLVLVADDEKALRKELRANSVEYQERKGADIAGIIIALGGGVGIAASLRPIASALVKYFEYLEEKTKTTAEVQKAAIAAQTEKLWIDALEKELTLQSQQQNGKGRSATIRVESLARHFRGNI